MEELDPLIPIWEEKARFNKWCIAAATLSEPLPSIRFNVELEKVIGREVAGEIDLRTQEVKETREAYITSGRSEECRVKFVQAVIDASRISTDLLEPLQQT